MFISFITINKDIASNWCSGKWNQMAASHCPIKQPVCLKAKAAFPGCLLLSA